jgi:imidazoleglycerol phosphate synthase glutamine amidotransferase subunit HisH
MIGIINANSENSGSLINAFNFLNIEIEIITESSQISKFKKTVSPGVGNFVSLKKNLIDLDLYNGLKNFLIMKIIFFLVFVLVCKFYSQKGQKIKKLMVSILLKVMLLILMILSV